MAQDQSLPFLWLLSDPRNDAVLETALAALPKGSGFVFRHYHLHPQARRTRFDMLADIARQRGHRVVLSDSPVTARRWGADGVYGAASRMPRGDTMLKLATAHDWKEIVAAKRVGADGIFLSPVFTTRSHHDAKPLGPVRFRMLAAKAAVPVIALGGMNEHSARRLGWPRWGAIDGLA